jgi:DNA-binding transcriptional ArsR family regulator
MTAASPLISPGDEASPGYRGRVTSGHPDIAAAAAAIGDRSRTAILLALAEGRALPASLLATEAGVGLPTVSAHLARLTAAGLVSCEVQGRHRYYRLADSKVSQALEALAGVAPTSPVRSLRESTHIAALRRARTCYDHLAGQLGVAIMHGLLGQQILAGGDGFHRPTSQRNDRLAAPGHDITYELTSTGVTRLTSLGVVTTTTARRPLIRYCVDWSEQRHHLAGALGAALAARLFELGWISHGRTRRTVVVTELGQQSLAETFHVSFNTDRSGPPRPG